MAPLAKAKFFRSFSSRVNSLFGANGIIIILPTFSSIHKSLKSLARYSSFVSYNNKRLGIFTPLGTISLEPVLTKENDFYHIFSGDEKNFKPYCVAHSKIRTLALLDEEKKGSHWLHWRVVVDGRRTLQTIETSLLWLPKGDPNSYNLENRQAHFQHLIETT